MIHAQNTKYVNVLDPVSKATGAYTMDNVIDTLGYDYAVVIFHIGAVAGATSELHLEQSDTGSGDWTTAGVTAFDFDGGKESDGTTAALPSATDDDSMFVFEVDCRGLQRYLRVEATADGTNLTSCVAILSRAAETSNVPADRGAAGLIQG
jgi:hypothetical protein